MVDVGELSKSEIGWKFRAARNRISEQRGIDFSQEDMAGRLGVSYQQIGKVERGEVVFERWNYNRVEEWATAYEVDPLEVADWMGMKLPIAGNLQPANLNTTAGQLVPVGLRRVKVLGQVNGGMSNVGVEEEYIPEVDYRPNCVMFVYTGSSMTDPITPDAPHSLQEGDRVLVDTSLLNLQHGKMYVIGIAGSSPVVKMAERLGNQWWLRSRNESEHPPFQADEAKIIGRVYKKLPRSIDL